MSARTMVLLLVILAMVAGALGSCGDTTPTPEQRAATATAVWTKINKDLMP